VERFVNVPGGRLFATGDGTGPPVVLAHAAITDLHSWDSMIPGLLSAGFRVVRYDQRGFGASTTEDVDYASQTDLLAVLDAFDIGRAAIVGNSRGGYLAIDAAIEYPARVVAVVALGAGPGGFDGGATPEEQALFEQGERLESAAPRDPDAISDLLVRIWVDGPGGPPGRADSAIREKIRADVRALYQPGHVAGRRTALEPPANDRLGELRCPVVAVAGGLDFTYAVESAHRLVEAAPNARAVVWPDVAHMIGMEAPDRLNALIADFLAPLRPWE
jgi:3-oxoadipate enol-lactonase